MLVTQHSWMNYINISEIIWELFQAESHHMD